MRKLRQCHRPSWGNGNRMVAGRIEDPRDASELGRTWDCVGDSVCLSKKQKITARRKVSVTIKSPCTQGRKCPLVAANVLQTEGESV